MLADELFVAYVAADEQVLTSAFPTNARFEEFRKDFRGRVLKQWEAAARRPIHAAFMLDVAHVAELARFRYWADFIALGATYLRERAEPPGVDASADAFEIAWYKAAVALHHGRRRPDLAAAVVVDLYGRMTAVPAPPPAPPMLVDPWITIARGFAEEAFAIDDPSLIGRRGRNALTHYQEALRHASTRAEAAVRAARILLRLEQPADALTLLDTFEDGSTTDPVFRYWQRLFRGEALDALGRQDEAVAAYTGALAIVPNAPSPRLAMMAMAVLRHADAAAEAEAAAVRTAPDPVVDPWWNYPHGDRRFLEDRMAAMRALSRR